MSFNVFSAFSAISAFKVHPVAKPAIRALFISSRVSDLWPVADPSMRDFMVEFYRRFSAETESMASDGRS